MARGRMLNKNLATSRKFDDLKDDFTRLVYCMALPFADRDGRINGEPCLVRSMAFPRRDDVNNKKIEASLKMLDSFGLIEWYSVDGERYIQFTKFAENQEGMRYDREQESSIPDPSQSDAGAMPDEHRSDAGPPPVEEKRREDNIKRREVESAFDKFYTAYPKKRDKEKARKAFSKAYDSMPDIDSLILIIKSWGDTEDWKKEDGKYVPLPSTWINGKRWEDAIPSKSLFSGKKSPTGGKANFVL